MPPGPRVEAPKKPKNTKKVISNIMAYLKKYKLRLFLVALFVVISSVSSVAGTYFLKPIIDNYIVPLIGNQNPDFSGLFKILCVLASIYLSGVLSSLLYSRIMITVASDTLYRMRNDMFRKMQTLPIRYFDKNANGDIMSRYTNDIDTMRNMLSQSIPQLISSVITVVGVFVMMLTLSIPLTVIVVLIFFIITKVIGFIGGKSANYYRNQQKKLGAVNGYIEEMIEGQKVVKVFCYEDESKSRFKILNDELKEAATNANIFASVLGPVMNNLSYFHYALTAVIGSSLAIMTLERDMGIFALGLGSLISFLQYTRSFAQPINQLSQQFNVIINALAGAERIFDLIEEESETDDGYVTLVNCTIDNEGKINETKERTGKWAWKHPHRDGTVTYTEVLGAVEFEDVEFEYEENKTVLNGISLYAKTGQKIAFVGSTGAGKTTITNLINRFYDVPDGKIRYDGININKIKKSDLRRSLSMVLQDTHLFTGTVMENIRYGRLDATDEEVIAAAKLANADWFIKHLPNGYDTMITADGGNLSQGQRQLIAIARAAVADPPVLILDEATSSVDTRTEALIEKGMDSLMEGRTVFVIAHRLSTVKNAHAIMVLENGRIIERGNHEQLIEQKGKYYQLYTGMFELS